MNDMNKFTSISNNTSLENLNLKVDKKYKRMSEDPNKESSTYNSSLSRTMTFLIPSFVSVVLAATVFTISNDSQNVMVQAEEEEIPSATSLNIPSIPLIATNTSGINDSVQPMLDSSSRNYENTFMSLEKSYDCRSEETNQDTVSASGLYINGEFMGAAESQAELDFLLNGMLNKKVVNDQDSVCYFAEDVECVKGIYPVDDVMSYQEIKETVNSKKIENTVYIASEGDTVESIAAAKNTTVDEICKANDIHVESEISEGDVLSVPEEKPYLSFCVEKNVEYEKEFDYNTITVEDDSHYKGYSNVKTQGVNGLLRCVDNVKYENGIEVSRTPLSEEIIMPAVDMVIEVGTKEFNETDAKADVNKVDNTDLTSESDDCVVTSNFIWPVTFTHNITSPYGARWGTFHNGIDIAGEVSYGQDILASDGGVVTRASDLNDGYGIYVIIDHGNGYKTLYAHTSKVYVEVGQRVSKGQKIAEIGSTGFSTGPHLHFEILYNNQNLDPLNFVS